MRRGGFSILEVFIVLAVFAIVGAVALPSIREVSRRRQEIETSGGTQTLLHTARDTAYKELHCVEVREDNSTGTPRMVAEVVPCLPADAGPVQIDTVSLDADVVKQLDISGTGRLVFQPSGGLVDGSPPRVVRIKMKSGREAMFEIQPALGTIRECREYDPNKVPSCTL
jgi:Tfp pilus assembly protein FimT